MRQYHTNEGWHPSRLGNLCFGVQQSPVGIGAVKRGLEGNAPQPSGPPQLQQGLLADGEGEHRMYKGSAQHVRQLMRHSLY